MGNVIVLLVSFFPMKSAQRCDFPQALLPDKCVHQFVIMKFDTIDSGVCLSKGYAACVCFRVLERWRNVVQINWIQ